MKRVLILGAGQIGTFAARAIAARGAQVVAADNHPAPGYFGRYGPRGDVPLARADIGDPRQIEALIRRHGSDTVVFTAGLGGAECANDPDLARRINVDGAIQAGETARRAKARRLVFVSSFAVYGSCRAPRVGETESMAPESCYGRTKAEAETGLLALRGRRFEVCVLRPCGVFGPLRLSRGSHSARLIETLLVAVTHGKQVVLKASRDDADEYLYVKDLARAVALAALPERPLEFNIFNIGPGRKTSAEDLVRALRRIAPRAPVRIQRPKGSARAVLPPLDTQRAWTVLGFRPRFSLLAAFRDYLKESQLHL